MTGPAVRTKGRVLAAAVAGGLLLAAGFGLWHRAQCGRVTAQLGALAARGVPADIAALTLAPLAAADDARERLQQAHDQLLTVPDGALGLLAPARRPEDGRPGTGPLIELLLLWRTLDPSSVQTPPSTLPGLRDLSQMATRQSKRRPALRRIGIAVGKAGFSLGDPMVRARDRAGGLELLASCADVVLADACVAFLADGDGERGRAQLAAALKLADFAGNRLAEDLRCRIRILNGFADTLLVLLHAATLDATPTRERLDPLLAAAVEGLDPEPAYAAQCPVGLALLRSGWGGPPESQWLLRRLAPAVRCAGEATFLRAMTQMLELVGEPSSAAPSLVVLLDEPGGHWSTPGAAALILGLDQLRRESTRCLSQLHLARLSLAATEHRHSRGSWPGSLAELADDFPGGVPSQDPITGRPYVLERSAQGLRIRSPDASDPALDWFLAE